MKQKISIPKEKIIHRNAIYIYWTNKQKVFRGKMYKKRRATKNLCIGNTDKITTESIQKVNWISKGNLPLVKALKSFNVKLK